MSRGEELSPDAGHIPREWLADSPESLMAGDGPYALALALALGTVSLPLRTLRTGPKPSMGGGYARVFEQLERAFLVVSEGMTAGETIQCHGAIWDWVEKLAPAGDQHDLSFIFILPPDAQRDYEHALPIGLGFEIDPAATGHAAWQRSGSLCELLDTVRRTRRIDLLPLRAVRAGDARYVALATLRAAVAEENLSRAGNAVREVLKVFSGHEYHLDIFCRAPSHRNGNLLRDWLNAAAAGRATPDWLRTGKMELPGWLGENENRRASWT